METLTPPTDDISCKPATTATWSVQVTINHRRELEAKLDDAVGNAIEQARNIDVGILVTRNTPQTYTVEVSEAVPYGTIAEHSVN